MDCFIPDSHWESFVTNFSKLPCKNSIGSVVRRLCFGAIIYFLWQERNFRNFRNEKRDWNTLFKMICETVKTRLLGLKVMKSAVVDRVKQVWGIQLDISQ